MIRIPLTDEQRTELQSLRQSDLPAVARSRLEMVFLSDAGWSAPRIARHLGTHPHTVRAALKGYRQRDTAAFYPDKPEPEPDHDRSPDDLPAFKLAADLLTTAGKLLGLVFQVPESFCNTADNREWLVRVGEELRPHRVAVEFRHRSWAANNLKEWMEHVGLDLVSVGVPDVPTIFPRGLRIANRRIYARLHSQNADNWYQDGKLRYNYDYPDAALREWAEGLKSVADANLADDALFFFNNCVGTQAVKNAKRLAAILKVSATNVRVIDAAATPKQPSLFGDDP